MVTFRQYEVLRYVFSKKKMNLMMLYLDLGVLLGMAHREIIKLHKDDLEAVYDKIQALGYGRYIFHYQQMERTLAYDLVFGSDSKIGVIGASTINQNIIRCCELCKIQEPPTSKDLKKLHGRLFVASDLMSKTAFNTLRRRWGFDSNRELAEWIEVELPDFPNKEKRLPNYKLRDELSKYVEATETIPNFFKFKGVDLSDVKMLNIISLIYKL